MSSCQIKTCLPVKENMSLCLLVKKTCIPVINVILSAPRLLLHVRPQLRILRLNVYRHSEDASCINQAFGEDAQHAFMYLTHGRREEADDGKRKTSYQHPYG